MGFSCGEVDAGGTLRLPASPAMGFCTLSHAAAKRISTKALAPGMKEKRRPCCMCSSGLLLSSCVEEMLISRHPALESGSDVASAAPCRWAGLGEALLDVAETGLEEGAQAVQAIQIAAHEDVFVTIRFRITQDCFTGGDGRRSDGSGVYV